MNRKRIIIAFLIYVCQLSATAQVSRSPFQYVGKDSVKTYITDRYNAHSFLHSMLMGNNYRNQWNQPVVLPVFRMSATQFKIEELGGGMQTKSLQLEDANGKEWALRTIDKDVAGALPSFLEQSLVQKVMQDQISSAMPYSPVIVGALSKSAHVNAPQPTFYFVADDAGLGPYRHIFANTICMLEEREPGFQKTDNTKEALRQVQSTSRYIIQQEDLLKARLLDMLIGDWDRHYDNWRWGIRDSAGLHIYNPIPRDRDWAFYYSGGLFTRLVRLAALRFMVNFTEEPRRFKRLSYKAHALDGAFLNKLDAKDWRAAIHNLQQSLTGNVIRQAVEKLPPPIFANYGESLIKKLKGRRDGMEKQAMKYYRFLSEQVQIDGSNDNEIFSFLPAEDGFVLQIFRAHEKGNKRQKIYERKFLREETYRITINGLGGNDQFEIHENVRSAIRIKLNGGTGVDQYTLAGNVRTEVHEEGAEKNIIANKNRSKVYFH